MSLASPSASGTMLNCAPILHEQKTSYAHDGNPDLDSSHQALANFYHSSSTLDYSVHHRQHSAGSITSKKRSFDCLNEDTRDVTDVIVSRIPKEGCGLLHGTSEQCTIACTEDVPATSETVSSDLKLAHYPGGLGQLDFQHFSATASSVAIADTGFFADSLREEKSVPDCKHEQTEHPQSLFDRANESLCQPSSIQKKPLPGPVAAGLTYIERTQPGTPAAASSVSASSIYPTSLMGSRHFVSEQMPIPESDFQVWQSRIKDPLKKALQRMSKATDDYEAYGVIEFYMAGRNRNKLRPRIIITCCSTARKRELKGILRKLTWLKDTGLKPLLIVDDSFGYRTRLSPKLKGPRYDVEASFPLHSSSLCGIPARTTLEHHESGLRTTAAFTIGGLILVNGQMFGLTTAHSFIGAWKGLDAASQGDKKLDDHLDSYNTFDDSDGQSDDSGSETSDTQNSVSFMHEANNTPWSLSTPWQISTSAEIPRLLDQQYSRRSDSTQINLSHISSEAPNLNTPIFLGRIHAYALDSTNVPRGCESYDIQNQDNQDWAIVSIENGAYRENTIQIPDKARPTKIYQYVCEGTVVAGKVWVMTGSGGLQMGNLHPSTVSIQLGMSAYEVQQVTLAHGIGMSQLSRIT